MEKKKMNGLKKFRVDMWQVSKRFGDKNILLYDIIVDLIIVLNIINTQQNVVNKY